MEAPVSVLTVPSGTGTSEKGGWKEAAGEKKKKKGGSKPQGAVSLADLKSELSAISLGESQGQVVDVKAMEVTVGGDRGDLSGWDGKRSGFPAASGFREHRTRVRCSFPSG